MLCSSALRRLAAQAPKRPTTDVTALANRFYHLSLRSSSIRVSVYSRSFATDDRPVGRPKKGGAVTAKASTRRTPSKARAPAKKKAAAAKPKKAAKKKAKPAPKKKAKVLTAAQKEKAEHKKLRAEIKELTAVSLLRDEPKAKPATAWTVYNAENVPKGGGLAGVHAAMRENGTKYKNLTPAEREHYNHVANQAKADNEVAYKRWVESHTPEDVKKANAARRRLKQLHLKDGKVKKGSNAYSPIKDERQVKRPRTSYSIFFTERQKSGDFKQISVAESAKLAGSEWKALSQAEKKNYEDLYKEDLQRYKRQFKDTYGFEAPFNGSHAAAATVSA